ncbi:uncharacterized protein LOC110349237 [Heterocephalus glaber]|uniref:Uncharacterized protein LOC110349237 n=1 Tax=Heterocephalus glaber TaxID=10181 RepID=A0AAX6T0J6_HETGA|nr:uncharacterized protein LOC110349237 [Heterocephalus glaber]
MGVTPATVPAVRRPSRPDKKPRGKDLAWLPHSPRHRPPCPVRHQHLRPRDRGGQTSPSSGLPETSSSALHLSYREPLLSLQELPTSHHRALGSFLSCHLASLGAFPGSPVLRSCSPGLCPCVFWSAGAGAYHSNSRCFLKRWDNAAQGPRTVAISRWLCLDPTKVWLFSLLARKSPLGSHCCLKGDSLGTWGLLSPWCGHIGPCARAEAVEAQHCPVPFLETPQKLPWLEVRDADFTHEWKAAECWGGSGVLWCLWPPCQAGSRSRPLPFQPCGKSGLEHWPQLTWPRLYPAGDHPRVLSPQASQVPDCSHRGWLQGWGEAQLHQLLSGPLSSGRRDSLAVSAREWDPGCGPIASVAREAWAS